MMAEKVKMAHFTSLILSCGRENLKVFHVGLSCLNLHCMLLITSYRAGRPPWHIRNDWGL